MESSLFKSLNWFIKRINPIDQRIDQATNQLQKVDLFKRVDQRHLCHFNYKLKKSPESIDR